MTGRHSTRARSCADYAGTVAGTAAFSLLSGISVLATSFQLGKVPARYFVPLLESVSDPRRSRPSPSEAQEREAAGADLSRNSLKSMCCGRDVRMTIWVASTPHLPAKRLHKSKLDKVRMKEMIESRGKVFAIA